MKRIKKSVMLLLIAGMVSFTFNSCEKDKSNNDEVKKYLSVNNAEFVAKRFPAPSDGGPQIDDILGNSSVIEGGSNPVSIYTNDNISKILVGVEGQGGYYECPATNMKSTGYYMISIVLSTDIPGEEFVIVVAVVTSDGLVSERYELPVDIIEVGTGKLQVSLSWDQLNDVDLHLVEPDGEEIYYSTDYSSNGGLLDLDSNAGCGIDGVNNENITYSEEESTLEAGEYIVRVDYYSDCDVTAVTNYIVTVRLNGELISGSGITNPYYGSFEPDEADWGGAGDGVEVMRFTLSSSQLKSTATRKIRTIKFANERTHASTPEKMSMDK